MVSTIFRDPQGLSSTLAALGTLQPRVFGSLNRVETLDSASNYYDVWCSTRVAVEMYGVALCSNRDIYPDSPLYPR